ncbi:MAG: hypothetical protein AAGI38_21705 [Bacteroidota bacterium]
MKTLRIAHMVAQFHMYSAIEFISEDVFPFSIWQSAIPLVREVDWTMWHL